MPYRIREAAAVVRRIFQSVLAGETIASIAKELRAEKIPILSEHWKRAGEPVRTAKYADPYAWSATTILAVIQRVSWYVRHNEKEFTERVREGSDQNQEKTVKECKQKISKAQKRHKELDGLVKKLYEGNATGKIPDKHFTRLLAEYDEEQTGLETSIAEWQRQNESWNADKQKTDQFIQLVKRYTDFSELTTPICETTLYYFRTERSEVICAMFCGCRCLQRRSKRLESNSLFPSFKLGNNTTGFIAGTFS
ncbi:recombinase family protein [uncultured Oscillibacter sp.]|uniref:recombinase family protein n=1 Tax=uncultured Oscillibacter sp. TaxID=876091 RepID=UPI002608E822|nr:recombinase family protein [uncultured Oscillibacter sp.]